MAATLLVLSATGAWARCSDNPGAGAFLDAVRAQIDAACPCATATSGRTYRVCAKAVVKAALVAGTLPRQCRSIANKSITKSACGRAGYATCCSTTSLGRTVCRVGLETRCLAPATSGTTASCYDACGPVCGDGIVQAPEQCDDRNAVAGDGCTPACERELVPDCQSIPASEYLAAFGADEFFQHTLIRVQHLGFNPTLIGPIRCTTPGGGERYSAFLARSNATSTEVLQLESDTTLSAPFSTTAIQQTGPTSAVEHFAYGSLRYDAPLDGPTTIEVLDISGLPFDPSDPFPTVTRRYQCGKRELKCIKDTISNPQCVACAAYRARGCKGLPLPDLLICEAAGRASCSACKDGLRECHPLSCLSASCHEGTCGFGPAAAGAVAPGTGAALPSIEDWVCRENPCPSGDCPDACAGCTMCNDAVCDPLDPASQPNRPVMAYVSGDAGYNLPLSCWADAGPPCGFSCDAAGNCTAITSCAIIWGSSVQYLLCSGAGALPWGFCSGDSGVYFTDTCGLACGMAGTLCDANVHRELAWSDFPACEDARGWGVHIPPGTHTVGERFWFTPEEKVRQCCPFLDQTFPP